MSELSASGEMSELSASGKMSELSACGEISELTAFWPEVSYQPPVRSEVYQPPKTTTPVKRVGESRTGQPAATIDLVQSLLKVGQTHRLRPSLGTTVPWGCRRCRTRRLLADRHGGFWFLFSGTGRCSVLFCSDPSFTVPKRKLAVSTDWYRYHYLLTTRTGPGCKHRLVMVPVCAYSPDRRGAALRFIG